MRYQHAYYTLRFVEIGIQQQVRHMRLDVVDQETLELPMGEVAAWKLELTALDDDGGNQTLWVSQDSPRKLLKAQGNLPPAMGGAGFTTELIGSE